MKPSGGCNILGALKRTMMISDIDTILLVVGSVYVYLFSVCLFLFLSYHKISVIVPETLYKIWEIPLSI